MSILHKIAITKTNIFIAPQIMLPFVVPSKWILQLLDTSAETLTEFIPTNIVQHNIASIILTLDVSDDADEIMSAITALHYLSNRDFNLHAIICEFISDFEIERWRQLAAMRLDVVRESIRLLHFFDEMPADQLIEVFAEYAIHDTTSANILVDVWIASEWSINMIYIYAIQNSSIGWKIVQCEESFNDTSFNLISDIAKEAEYDMQLWTCIGALLGTNSSVIEYLMYIDTINGEGIASTFNTINHFSLWDAVLYNPAIGRVIDYAFDNYENVCAGSFASREQLRKWIIPRLGPNNTILKYATVEDIAVSSFTNPFMIELIKDWIDTQDVRDIDIDNYMICNIVSIAASTNEECSKKALRCIDEISVSLTGFLSIDELTILINGKYSRDYMINKLIETQETEYLLTILHLNDMLPYWTQIDSDSDLELCNLNSITVQCMRYDTNLLSQTKQLAYQLDYDEWIILFKTPFGIQLGVDNINYVISVGVLYALLKSPLLLQSQILNLNKITNISEYCEDEELTAIMRRADAYDIDKIQVYRYNRNLCDELLMVWHEPMRLSKFAKGYNLSLYEYLHHM